MSKDRIEFVDAMRGISMFMVVFVHVETFCFFNFSFMTFLGSYLTMIVMPIFFFISGLVGYNTKPTTYKQIKNKVSTLIIPMFILGLLYTYLFLNKNVFDFINETAKQGYWFTLVLFEMYIIYYFVRYLHNKLKFENYTKSIIFLVCLSVLMYAAKYPMRMISPLDKIGSVFSLHYTMNFFQFFVLGIVFTHFKEKIDMFLNKYLNTIILPALFIILSLLGAYYKYSTLDPGISNIGGLGKIFSMLTGTVSSYFAVLGYFLIFRKFKMFFIDENKFSSILKFIGRRTLDIYLLHYFILISVSFFDYSHIIRNNTIIEVALVSLCSICVVLFTLLISSIIRKNNIMARLLLGVK